jgi:hypothetical protein
MNRRFELDAGQERTAQLAVQGVRFLRRRREPFFQHYYPKGIHALCHVAALEVILAGCSERLPDCATQA